MGPECYEWDSNRQLEEPETRARGTRQAVRSIVPGAGHYGKGNDRQAPCMRSHSPPHIRVLTLSQWKPVFPEGGNVANSPRVTLLLLP